MTRDNVLVLLIALTLLAISVAFAQPLVRVYGVDGTNQSSASNPFPINTPAVALINGTAKAITVTNSSQIVTFPVACNQITLNNTSASNTLYVNPFGSTASASNFPIAAGQSLTIGSSPGLTQVSLFASGSSTIGVLAH